MRSNLSSPHPTFAAHPIRSLPGLTKTASPLRFIPSLTIARPKQTLPIGTHCCLSKPGRSKPLHPDLTSAAVPIPNSPILSHRHHAIRTSPMLPLQSARALPLLSPPMLPDLSRPIAPDHSCPNHYCLSEPGRSAPLLASPMLPPTPLLISPNLSCPSDPSRC
jgi:hypothetical protein